MIFTYKDFKYTVINSFCFSYTSADSKCFAISRKVFDGLFGE